MKRVQIVFKCDEAFRRKLRTDKLKRENKLRTILTWEEYIEMLFYGRRGI